MSRALVFSALVGVLACSDVNPGVPVPADIEVTSSESCLREGCFDNDPCTEDQCLATGQCVFVPNDPENACIEDHHCDLGTECVIGRCEVNECGLRRCSFEEVADCRACGPAFGEACSDRDPCTLNFCDASAGRCDFERLECDARCSTQAAMAEEGAGPLEAGVQRAFIGPVTAFEKTCPTGCRCEVPSYLLAGTPSGLRLLDPTSGVPMTCRLDACGDEPILDCAPFYKSREIVVFGETVDLEPGPPARSGAPLVHIPDALRIHTSCPAVRNIGSFGNAALRMRATHFPTSDLAKRPCASSGSRHPPSTGPGSRRTTARPATRLGSSTSRSRSSAKTRAMQLPSIGRTGRP